MRCAFVFILGAFLYFPGVFWGELVNESLINVYLRPEKDTEVCTQAIYADSVEVLHSSGEWSNIKTADGMQGWVLSSQLVSNPSYEASDHLRPTKSFFTHIYRVTDTTPYPPLLTLPYGAKVKLERPIDTGERWFRIELVSGEKAWVQRGDIDFTPRRKTMSEVFALSRKFLGFPYTWGGKSSYGFDCSGFTQMLFKEMGLLLPHSSQAQMDCDFFIPVEEEDLEPGDLVFFGYQQMNHVGLYLGQDEYIHADIVEEPVILITSMKSKVRKFWAGRRINPLIDESSHFLENLVDK